MKFQSNALKVLTILIALVAFGLQAFQEPKQQRKRNLKVLPENITRDSLDALMDFYCESLKVKCSFCHAPRENDPKKLNFTSDAKPEKEIARQMINMTNELNRKYFTFKETVNTGAV
ncbi:MAG TPA: c-type cytochrome, partial [Chitinophagaceae bacterium]|nr:c-type cytochrome [Chitinophagaceae bacterium]HAN38159.1 c-type cytochrome [Chitinophagaceae bacterium]